MSSGDFPPRVAILGAGPVGLDAALACADEGLPFTLYEAGPRPAHHVRAWGHVRLFSPWRLNVSPRARSRLEAQGWTAPPEDEHPTGDVFADRVLEPLAELPEIAPRLELETRVVAVGRRGLLKHEEISTDARARRPFRLLVKRPDGSEEVREAEVVLDCTGTYSHPNATGDGGVPAPGERAAGDRIVRHLPDVLGAEREAWAGRTVLLVGGGHSAQTAARDLERLAGEEAGTRTLWALRDPEPGFARIPDDPLPERDRLTVEAGALARGEGSGVRPLHGRVVARIDRPGKDGSLSVTLRRSGGGRQEVTVDRILSLTGYAPDRSLHRQLQVHECYATEAPMKLAASLLESDAADCLAGEAPGAETLVNPEPDYYVLGVKSYGLTSTFLLRDGWEQVEGAMGWIRKRPG